MSEIRANTISAANGTGPITLTKQRAATTLHTFDQPADNTVDSLNISSGLDAATGAVVHTFTNHYSSATQRQVMFSGWNTDDGGTNLVAGASRGLNAYQNNASNATNTVRTQTTYGANASSNGAVADVDGNYLAIFGDLA